jgi:ribosomal protein L31
MYRPTLQGRNLTNVQSTIGRRLASGYQLDGPLPKRPQKKIHLGKARPAIYYKFNCKTEFSDGSVVVRRSVFPKDELRLIQDQRNTPLWNPNRVDLDVVDANAGGRMEKFKQKFAQFSAETQASDDAEKTKQATESKSEEVEEQVDDYLDLLGENVQEVQKGGKLAVKQKRGKK